MRRWRSSNCSHATPQSCAGTAPRFAAYILAAGDKDIRPGGGSATIREYLKAGLVDEMHIAISPCLLGSGEPLFAGLDLKALGFQCTEHVPTDAATHVVLTKAA